MRILLWSELFWPTMGGGSQFSAELAAELQSRGHEVLAITRQDDESISAVDEYRGVPVHRFPFYGVLSTGNVEQIARQRHLVIELRRRFAPDLVHTTSFGPSMLFQAITAEADRAPRVVTLFGEEIPSDVSNETILHCALEDAAWVTAPSRATLDYALGLVPTCAARSSVIPVGSRLPMEPPTPPAQEAVLVCVGRLAPIKGFDVAIAAMSTVLERRPDAVLRIAGDGLERASLEEQAAHLGVANAVEFLGWVSPKDVPALLGESSLLLIPSRSEAFPLVGVQAALMARPVVAASVGGVPELVVDRKTGILVEPEAPVALALAVLELLDQPLLAQRMGRAARARGLEQFRLERVADKYEELFRRLVDRPRTAAGVPRDHR